MRKPIASLFMALAAGPLAAAEPVSSVVEKIVDCADLQRAEARLACFDREVAPLRQQRSAATVRTLPAPAAAPIPVPAPEPPAAPRPGQRGRMLPAPTAAPPVANAPVATPSFGEEQLAPKRREAEPEAAQALHARIAGLRSINANTFLVTLDNGQVWRHEDSHLGSYLRIGDAITIGRGAMGSYRLTRDAGASRNWIRVTRVR